MNLPVFSMAGSWQDHRCFVKTSGASGQSIRNLELSHRFELVPGCTRFEGFAGRDGAGRIGRVGRTEEMGLLGLVG